MPSRKSFSNYILTVLLLLPLISASSVGARQAHCTCRGELSAVGAINTANQIAEIMGVVKMLDHSQNAAAVRRLKSWLHVEVAVGKKLLVIMTTSAAKNGMKFEASPIGWEMSRALKLGTTQQKFNPEAILPKKMQHQLGKDGMALFSTVYEYEHGKKASERNQKGQIPS